jgi:DNA-binding MarR family transcriptional regulator
MLGGYHRDVANTREAPRVRVKRSALSPRDSRLAGWRELLTAHSLLVRRLDEELQTQVGLSMFEYSALLEIAEAPERRLRMSEIADGIFLTRSGVTRLIGRLETDGLVERRNSLSDGRGAEAELTDTGLARLRAASSVHLQGIETYYFDRVSQQDQETVGRVMKTVADGVRGSKPGTD